MSQVLITVRLYLTLEMSQPGRCIVEQPGQSLEAEKVRPVICEHAAACLAALQATGEVPRTDVNAAANRPRAGAYRSAGEQRAAGTAVRFRWQSAARARTLLAEASGVVPGGTVSASTRRANTATRGSTEAPPRHLRAGQRGPAVQPAGTAPQTANYRTHLRFSTGQHFGEDDNLKMRPPWGAPGSAGRASGSQAWRRIPVVQAER
jgi:hypothetical protein